MSKDIWSGKEPFLRGPVKEKQKKPVYFYILIPIIVILTAVIIHKTLFVEETVTITGEVIHIDDLSPYRNLTTEELLKKLNDEAGLKEANPLKEFEVFAGMYYFEPKEIRVKLNDKVRLDVKAIDVNHSIRIPGFFIGEELEAGKHKIIEFIAFKSGEYIYESKTHDNMRGKLIIEE